MAPRPIKRSYPILQTAGAESETGGPTMPTTTIRVELPYHLRNLAGLGGGEVRLEIAASPVHAHAVVDALEARFPMLRGLIREHVTRKRRAYLRFFACGQDISHDPMDAVLPGPVLSGAEPFIVLGAISGG